MNMEDQDEMETKEWEEALSLVETIFKDLKKSPDSDEPNDLLDVARWKVVWGKKPAQYRLKPFLMWSVDEMPSIPEECESFSEATHKTEEVNEILKIKKEKQMRFLRRKMFKMKRRIDEINAVLAKTLSDETVASLKEEESTKTAKILQLGAQRVELLDERNNIRDRLRKLNKKLIMFKGSEMDQLLGQRQDVGDAPESSDVKGTGTEEQPPNRPELHTGEPWNRGRRAAIKKEAKSIWSRPGSAKDATRSSCDLAVDRKTKKKRCCKGHHKKQESKIGFPGDVDMPGRQAHSESDLRTDAKDQAETSQQKHSEAQEGDEDTKKYELRASSSEFYKVLKERMPSARAGQGVSLNIPSRDSRARNRRNSVSEGALKTDGESVSSQTGSQTHISQVKQGPKKDINRAARSATDLAAESPKRPSETAKHWKTKRPNSNKDGRTVRHRTLHSSQPSENKEPADLMSKYRPCKHVENANRAEQSDVPGKRIPVSNVPS